MIRSGTTGIEELLMRAFGWRAILKFDFFFEGRADFRDSIIEELQLACPDAVDLVNNGDLETVARAFDPPVSPAVLLPFLEAYRIVAAVIAQADPNETLDAKTIAHRSLLLGRQAEAQGKITTPESMSTELFNSGIALAANAGLLGRADQEARDEFLADIDDALADLRVVQATARTPLTISASHKMTS
jgi:glycerol-3-phosphate O-acyltransferase